jgi:hypothetical protein
MKNGKKLLAVLSTSAMLASVPAASVLPVFANVAHAATAGSVSALVVPTISTGQQYAEFGTIHLFVPNGSLTGGENTVTLTLPNGFSLDNTVAELVYKANLSDSNYTKQDGTTTSAPTANYVNISGGKSGDNVSLKAEKLTNTSIRLTVSGTQSDDVDIYIKLGQVKVNGPSNGPVNVSLLAPSNSALPSGTVTVANVQTSGVVDLASTDTQSSSDNFQFNLRLSEEVAGSLRNANNSIKLKLPSGFKWDSNQNVNITDVYGVPYKGIGLKVSTSGDDTLTITSQYTTDKAPFVDGSNNSYYGDTTQSNPKAAPLKDASGNYIQPAASSYIINGLSFHVDDESVAKTGDVTVQVTGSSSVNANNLVVGTYGDYGATVSVASKPTIIAGKKEQQIGDISIKENVANSFVNGRTITLTLPDGARWEGPFEDSKNATNGNYVGSITTTNGLGQPTVSYTDSDKRTLKLTINGSTSANSVNGGEIDLKNFQIATQPGFTGDLTVQVGGSAGVTGNVTVATVQAPVSVSASTKPSVVIGSAGQQIGDITLTENVAGGFGKTTDVNGTHNKVHLELPYGVQFDGTPNVSVTSGDLVIKDVTTGLGSDNKGYLDFYVDTESTTPSTIKITGAKLKLDRTVPQGDITLKVKGDAVSYTAYANDGTTTSKAVQTWADNNTTAASAVIATVATPAPGDTTAKATFTIGSTSYTVNGQQMTADVAPYIKNDRTYLPVTYVAQALGVPLQNIIWNNSERSVTIFKGDRVVKLVIGSNTLLVNGVQYAIDAAPEISNSRTMLPIAHLATALGVPYSWDATTQTVTFGN